MPKDNLALAIDEQQPCWKYEGTTVSDKENIKFSKSTYPITNNSHFVLKESFACYFYDIDFTYYLQFSINAW